MASLPLKGAGHKAADIVALENKKQDDAGKSEYDNTGFCDSIVHNTLCLYAHICNRKRQGNFVGIVDENERSNKIIPCRQECKKSHGDQAWLNRRNEYTSEGAECRTSVHHGSVVDLPGNRLESNSHHKHLKRKLENL